MTTSAPLPSVDVTHVQASACSRSRFHVSRVGVPMLVKISYYPRWHATGASGPYRVSPNLMVVVPTSKDVSLVYGSTPAITLGNVVERRHRGRGTRRVRRRAEKAAKPAPVG